MVEQRTPMGALVAALVFRGILILILGLTVPWLANLTNPGSTVESSNFHMNAWIMIIDVITIVVVARLLAAEGSRLGELLEFRASDIGWGLLFFLIIVCTFFLATMAASFGQNGLALEFLPQVPLWVGIAAVPAAVTIAIAEEVLYRGYLQPRFEQRLGSWPGMLVVALVFGLQHIGFALSSPTDAVARVAVTFVTGVVFALLYWWRKRLVPLIIAHALLDLLGLSLPTLMLALA